jgi:hypothetical protein
MSDGQHERATAWAAWHPKHGFNVPYYPGAIVSGDLDEVARHVRSFNAEGRTNNRTGWRAIKVELVKVRA